MKKEYSKLVTLLQAYALISTGVRIICTNQVSAGGQQNCPPSALLLDSIQAPSMAMPLYQVGSSARSTVISTQNVQTVRDNIVTVFGARAADGLEALQASVGAASLSG